MLERELPINDSSIRNSWACALDWYRKPYDSVKRSKQAKLIEAIKDGIEPQLIRSGLPLNNVPALHRLYESNSTWTVQMARNLYPGEYPTLSVHASSATAFGLKYVEYMIDRKLDAQQPLPSWIGEWITK